MKNQGTERILRRGGGGGGRITRVLVGFVGNKTREEVTIRGRVLLVRNDGLTGRAGQVWRSEYGGQATETNGPPLTTVMTTVTVPPIPYVEALTLAPQTVTIVGRRVFAEVIWLK